jgi:hypothetical protein
MRFGVWGTYGVSGFGFWVWGLGFRGWGLGLGVRGLAFGVWGVGFGVLDGGVLIENRCVYRENPNDVLPPVNRFCSTFKLGWGASVL